MQKGVVGNLLRDHFRLTGGRRVRRLKRPGPICEVGEACVGATRRHGSLECSITSVHIACWLLTASGQGWAANLGAALHGRGPSRGFRCIFSAKSAADAGCGSIAGGVRRCTMHATNISPQRLLRESCHTTGCHCRYNGGAPRRDHAVPSVRPSPPRVGFGVRTPSFRRNFLESQLQTILELILSRMRAVTIH